MTPFSALSPEAKGAVLVAVVGLICLALEPFAPWIMLWPDALTLPISDWIGAGLGAVLGVFKPVARGFSAVLGVPMGWATQLLQIIPWPLFLSGVVALGWYLGGWRMALFAFLGLMFVFASGYWSEAMNTLALVFVSVPLAVVMGLAIGIAAHEVPRIKAAIGAVLDVMQTIPTFAYLTPLLLLFGFGPVVGLVASAIYAAPPMARNVMLGLERVEPEIREAAVMSGSSRRQQLFLVELPAAATQIMVGVNQCLMAALSMVIIAAVIGGFDDIGWEVLLTMRKAQFGQAFLAGLVIVIFAILIDRMSATLALETKRHRFGPVWGIVAAGIVASVITVMMSIAADAPLLDPVAEVVDEALGTFTAEQGARLDSFKNGAMFFVLLPLRIGFDQAVLPFTWGFQWTAMMSQIGIAVAVVVGLALAWRGSVVAGAVVVIAAIVLETGISQLPWLFMLVAVGVVGWLSNGLRLAALCVGLLLLILVSGFWERALLSIYLSGTSVVACAIVGGGLGILASVSPMAWRILRPVCDMLQTIPLFVFLIPVLMFFQIGEFSAFLAICAYAIVPMIRYTHHGLVNTPPDLIEAAIASGATPAQILRDVRMPYAIPTVLLGLNQTILFAFAMLVIAALIGTTGLGQSIYLALGQADVGMGVSAGAAMAILAFIADRLVQGFAQSKRQALGLTD